MGHPHNIKIPQEMRKIVVKRNTVNENVKASVNVLRPWDGTALWSGAPTFVSFRL